MIAEKTSFDVVSEVNTEEVKNAIQIASKELKNRPGFKESIADIKLENDRLAVVAEDDYKVEQVRGILFGELVRHNVSIKSIHFSENEKTLGDTARQYDDLTSGIDKENTRRINTAAKSSGIKVKSQVQEGKIRITGENRDDLRKVMALLRELDLPMALEFNNYR